jgi:hypothetical protein
MSRKEPTRALVASASIALMASLSAGVWLWREKASVSDLARRELWKTALRVFYQHPVLGWGPDSFEDAFRLLRSDQFINVMGSMHHQAYPHNDILHVLTGVGLIGLGLYLCLWFQIGRTILKALGPLTQRAFAAALAAGLVSFWVTIELNPVALEVLVFSAIVAGLLYSLTTSELPLSWTRSRLMVLTIVLIGSFFYAAKMALADSVYKDALRAQAKHEFELARLRFGRARRLMPCEITFIVEQVNAIGDWINASHEVNERLARMTMQSGLAGLISEGK